MGLSQHVLHELGWAVPLCIPSFQSDRESPEESAEAQHQNDPGNSNLGHPNMVPATPGYGNRGASDASQQAQYPEGPTGIESPPRREQLHEAGCLADIREPSGTQPISDTATMLIKNARSSGTRRNYKLAWSQFSSCCADRQIDPVHCHLRHILSFLGNLFDRKLEYGSIGNYRSAISAFHDPIEGFKVGKHPLVASLMKGVSNERPPQPKYRYIWDVQRVLDACQDWPVNKQLTLKQLTYKVVTLLGLCNINRGAELHSLNCKWISRYSERFVCAFGTRAKNSKKGKSAKPIHFKRYAEDEKLCPVMCLQEYMDRTKKWRIDASFHPLFLGVNNPHKPVTKSTLTKWILKMLEQSGIDVSKFQTHSLSSSSKVASLRLTTADVLSMGNWSRVSTWVPTNPSPLPQIFR